MDKSRVLQLIIEALEQQLELAKGASLDAADYATNEEARAESKWDTQGLEASYLAAGQAAQVREIAESIRLFRDMEEQASHTADIVAAGSLVELELNGSRSWYFVSKAAGGLSVEIEGVRITVVTTQSPLGRNLPGKQQGDFVSLPNGAQARINSLR